MRIPIFGLLFFSCCMQATDDLYQAIIEQLSVPTTYAPWRDNYENTTSESAHTCVFCRKFAASNDEKLFVLARYKHHAVILNVFPYNKGHLLIIPYEHVPSLQDLSREARIELIELISETLTILQETMKPDAINVGINLGEEAGASIPDHLHIHILPRWKRDRGFLQVLGRGEVISCDLPGVYKRLKPKFEKITP